MTNDIGHLWLSLADGEIRWDCEIVWVLTNEIGHVARSEGREVLRGRNHSSSPPLHICTVLHTSTFAHIFWYIYYWKVDNTLGIVVFYSFAECTAKNANANISTTLFDQESPVHREAGCPNVDIRTDIATYRLNWPRVWFSDNWFSAKNMFVF